MKKIATFILLISLGVITSNCSSTRAEWMNGPKANGITTYDTCFKCGDRIIWIEPEKFHMQKSMARKGQFWTSNKYLDW